MLCLMISVSSVKEPLSRTQLRTINFLEVSFAENNDNNIMFYGVSAKTGCNVNECFKEFTKYIYQQTKDSIVKIRGIKKCTISILLYYSNISAIRIQIIYIFPSILQQFRPISIFEQICFRA